MATHLNTGKHGERIAANFLVQKGYEIKATNYRFGKAEIDLIAQKDGVLVFVEVKTRRSSKFGLPEEAVHHRKQRALVKAANAFVYEHEIHSEIRFDIISVSINNHNISIHHIEDAFFPLCD
ncbi:MAG: YraN family protein [Chitinophagales bacterium]|nr:YraN family protein [Chitinophagales bacterium]MDW8273071.1 YraN family protein [Chitinophagales bacterium]